MDNYIDLLISEDIRSVGKNLQNSALELLSRFLPKIEAFFFVNSGSIYYGVINEYEEKNSNVSEPQQNESPNIGFNNSSLVVVHLLV